jgi:hypothetical protein
MGYVVVEMSEVRYLIRRGNLSDLLEVSTTPSTTFDLGLVDIHCVQSFRTSYSLYIGEGGIRGRGHHQPLQSTGKARPWQHGRPIVLRNTNLGPEVEGCAWLRVSRRKNQT